MPEFIKAIPAAAQSPYALVAYAIAAVLMLYGGFRLYHLRAVLKALKGARKVDGTTLKEAIELATNTKLPERISGEQWIRNNRLQGILLISIALIVAATVITAIALVTARKTADGLTGADLEKVRDYLEELDISGETKTERLRQIFPLGYVLFGADHQMIFLPKDRKPSENHRSFDLKGIKLFGFTPTHLTITIPEEGDSSASRGISIAIPRATGLLEVNFSSPSNIALRAKVIKDYGTVVIAAIGFAEKGRPIPKWEKDNWEPWWLDQKFGPTQTMVMPNHAAPSNTTPFVKTNAVDLQSK